MNKIHINLDNCDTCCECVNICSQEVIGIRNGKIKVLSIEDCTFCEECVDICPNEVINIEYDLGD